MAKRHIVGIQNRFDNEAKFDFVLVRSVPFTEEEVLWAVFCYGRAYKYGRMPESWQSTELNESFDLLSLVYAPDQLVEYVDWKHRLNLENNYPRIALELIEFHRKEMSEAKLRIDAYTKEWAAKKLNVTVDDRMKAAMSGSALDMLRAMLPRD